MPENRPYTFELAEMALNEGPDAADIKTVATNNGVDLGQLDRATEILRRLQAGGEDTQDFIRREYILDGWIHGYLPLDTSPTDPTLTTWKLGQLADGHYRAQLP